MASLELRLLGRFEARLKGGNKEPLPTAFGRPWEGAMRRARRGGGLAALLKS